MECTHIFIFGRFLECKWHKNKFTTKLSICTICSHDKKLLVSLYQMKYNLYQVQYHIEIATFPIKTILEDISQMIIFPDI